MRMHLDMNDNQVISNHNLGQRGRVQRYIDSECIRYMAPYTPFLTGAMERSATIGTVMGYGRIVYNSPYARFQYYGRVMVDPDTGSTWAPLHGRKVKTDRPIIYNTSRHPRAGRLWFERMKADHKKDIIRGVRRLT